MNHHKVASRYWEIWGCWARERGAERPEKAWPVFLPEFSKIQWPTVKGFQQHIFILRKNALFLLKVENPL